MSGAAPRRGGFGEWLDQRVGWRKLMHEALDEPIPGGSRWAYVFGSGLLFIFISQAITGVLLSLYYVPSAEHAHISVSFIEKQVAAGGFIRSIHSYGSSVMIVLLGLHLMQTLVYGAYKSRRELLWIVGCLLFLFVLGMSFTGYLLPWDQKAYSATAVGTNIVSEVPVLGGHLKTLLRGGTEMGTLTLSRFFTLHVFVIPAMIGGAVALHIFLFRKAGAAGPPLREEERLRLPVEPFFPRQVVKDFFFGMVLLGLLTVLAARWPAPLGPQANPADPTYIPRPEWYYLPLFQWLKYWQGGWAIVGLVVIPAIALAALFTLPFLDRSLDRRPHRRPLVMLGAFVLVGGLTWLGLGSHYEDRRDPAVRAKLAAQAEEERRFTAAPFEPQEVGGLAARAHKMTAAEAKGALLFVNAACVGCHGPEGKGGPGLFKMHPVARMYGDVELEGLLRNPNKTMVDGGMEPVTLSGDDLTSLVAYLKFITSSEGETK
jgi:ubiquinol-cytochrome c reductase cytochrome b subunit